MQIHVRKYFESKYDKEIYPSKKGIAFTVPEWRDLKNQISVIDECIECSKNMLREEAGKIKQEFNRRNVRQLPPPDLYNGDGCEHTVSISRRREKCHTNSRITFMTTQLVGGNSFIYLSQTPTVPMQMYPSNFKESSGKYQHIKGKMR